MIDLERGEPAVALDDQGERSSSDAFLREIVELTSVPEVEPGDITVRAFAEKAGICKKTARARLDALVRRGILTMLEGKRCDVDSRRVRVWRKAVQE